MLFNSIEFIFFLGIVYGLYRIFPFRGQQVLLLLASIIFYGWWDARFLVLLIISATTDFSLGLLLADGQIPKKTRIKSSLFVGLSSLLFLGIGWNDIQFNIAPFSINLGKNFFSNLSSQSLLLIGGVLLYVTSANLLYPLLVKAKNKKKLLLFITVFVNLAILGFFKYFDFFITSTEQVLTALHIPSHLFHLNVILPLGISFYTFESISYCLDIYRGTIAPTRRLSEYLLFILYFPHLVAGPIIRPVDLMPQLYRPRTINFDQTMQGLYLILFGLMKKMAIADGLAASVSSAYSSAGFVGRLDILLATFLFAIQIYCDFSGYSDIAIGVSKLFGIEIPRNFRFPYFSRSPSEFWQRWHISLSSWLKDYLYIPLGGNHGSTLKTYRNLLLTMILGGLWHGAAWNFVIWGTYQGILLCAYRFLAVGTKPSTAPVRFFQTILFFSLVCYGWLLFRATSLDQIVTFTKTLLGYGPEVASVIKTPTFAALLGLPILFMLEIIYFRKDDIDLTLLAKPARGLLYALFIILILMGAIHDSNQFIYFQF